MGVSSSTALELRLIVEKMRNRFTVPSRLEGTSWSPKVMELPPGKSFLVVCPHPDDDAVGCGGTIIKLVDAGKKVRVIYLSIQEGKFTRESRKAEIEGAIRRLGVDDYVLHENLFPAGRDAAEMIRKELEANHDGVFIPSPFENHDHHLRTFQAYESAVRRSGTDPDVIMYEVWGTLMPNMVIPITAVMEKKLAAIEEHGTQTADIDYSRLTKGINGYRAAASSMEGYAEAFLHMPSSTMLKLFRSH